MQVWFFDCSHDNQGRSVIYDLIKKCSDLITKSAEKTSSTFRIIDLTFWPWRFQIIVLEKTVNKIQILNQSETKKSFKKIYIFWNDSFTWSWSTFDSSCGSWNKSWSCSGWFLLWWKFCKIVWSDEWWFPKFLWNCTSAECCQKDLICISYKITKLVKSLSNSI